MYGIRRASHHKETFLFFLTRLWILPLCWVASDACGLTPAAAKSRVDNAEDSQSNGKLRGVEVMSGKLGTLPPFPEQQTCCHREPGAGDVGFLADDPLPIEAAISKRSPYSGQLRQKPIDRPTVLGIGFAKLAARNSSSAKTIAQ